MKLNVFNHHPSEAAHQEPAEDWVGAYGFGGHHGPGYEPQPGERRDSWDRAADAFLASVGDENAAQRLRKDYIQANGSHS